MSWIRIKLKNCAFILIGLILLHSSFYWLTAKDHVITEIIWNGTAQEIDGKTKNICNQLMNLQFPSRSYSFSGTPQFRSRSPFVVVSNYFSSSYLFLNETVTYSTHSTFQYLDHISEISRRWDGPIEVAVFAPYSDFCITLDKILHLRNCDDGLVKEKVSWHLYWPKSSPPPIDWQHSINESLYSCKESSSYPKSWRENVGQPYPVNVGRNVARQMAYTKYVLPSDIELYPSLDLCRQFISYIKSIKKEEVNSPQVFVVPVFEAKTEAPDTKEELHQLLETGAAVYFHQLVCKHCQLFPGFSAWKSDMGTAGKIKTFAITKRHSPFHRWEPIYIGTKNEPLYDEQLVWEGLQDKMIQMYELCLLNYDFLILDRAFLVHAKGIKQMSQHSADKNARQKYITINSIRYNNIVSNLTDMYGENVKCKSK